MIASPTGGRNRDFGHQQPAGSIDSYIKADFTAHNITPAPPTTDWEFIRRVTLDLTGRIPTPDRVLSFVADRMTKDLVTANDFVDGALQSGNIKCSY